MKQNHYTYSIALWFVTTLYQQRQGMIHQARLKALAYLLQGLMALRQASLSGMGRGVALANPETTFRGQLQRAHRLIKNPQLDSWEAGAALFAYATQNLKRVVISVDWTKDGYYWVLEASLVVEGRAIPFYCLAVHRDELKGRQTTLELTMWFALIALRQAGQTLVVVADRGFAKFDWMGECEQYPWMHLALRLKGTTILTWGDISAPLRDWPLWPGEEVFIEAARLGVKQQVLTGVCLAHLGEVNGQPWYLACAAEEGPTVVEGYRKRVWIEEQNRDLKSGGCQIHHCHLATAQRIERLWVVVGMFFYLSYCTEAVHDTGFADRLSRRYQDGRKDLSWFSLARYAYLSGRCEIVLRPLASQ